MLATVRYPLLPRSYLEGLGDDVVTLVCRDQLKDALRQRKSLPELRRPVTLRKGMHYNKIYIAGGAGDILTLIFINSLMKFYKQLLKTIIDDRRYCASTKI